MSAEVYSFHPNWKVAGLTEDSYDEKVRWLEDRRELGDGCDCFFELSARLYQHCRGDYSISSAAFFHAVIGLERAFRNHYQGTKDSFADLFHEAIDEGLIHDAIISDLRPLPKELAKQIKDCPDEHCARLARLVPKWRNDYFHGSHRLHPEFFFIALQLREIADALTTRRLPYQ